MNPNLPVQTGTDKKSQPVQDTGLEQRLFAELSWKIRHADMRQELFGPIQAVIELAEILFKEAQEHGPEQFAADLQKVHDSGKLLLARVEETLDLAEKEDPGTDFGKRVRHELRTPLNPIINYCELWLEEAEDFHLQGFVPDLEKIRGYGKEILKHLEDIVSPPRPVHHPHGWQHPIPPPREEQSAVKGHLLVVDDNEINRDLLTRRLRLEGHTVAVACNGRQALEMIQEQPFDLVLLDIIMPEMNGFQVLAQLKADETLRHLPVIMISALNEVNSVVRCIEMGAEDYLTKPFNRVMLNARIGACLEKKRLLEQIEKERRRADALLHVILPGAIIKELKANDKVVPRRYENVAVLFCDIVGFTPFCDQNQPEHVVPHLQRLIETWEEVALRHQVEKIKTIGDAFMAAAGLLQQTADHPVLHCVRCGLEMIEVCRGLPTSWDVRVGIHVGPVVAGVIGRRQYLFDLWGDTVNTAARMESHGIPGSVVLSGPAWQQIAPVCRGTTRGYIPVKGKGELEMVRFEGFVD